MSTRIWHDRFENDWMRAFPLGNGRIGAMVYGNPYCEQIEINEESLWSGKQLEEKNSASPEKLQQIRNLLFEGKFEEARELCVNTFLADPPTVRFFESFGEIFINFHDKREYAYYIKELELGEAIARVSYDKGDMQYQSETFISEKYDAFVYKAEAGSKRFSCDVTIKRGQDSYTSVLDDNTILLNGTLTCETHPIYGEGFEGMSFGSRIHIVSDGVHSSDKHTITITDATYVIVYAAFATNYNVMTYDIDETIDYKSKLLKTIENIKDVDYDILKKEHIESHKKRFERVLFTLDGPTFDDVPTDVRLKCVQKGLIEDPDLYTLYYNFGRYLLIESSGKRATLPANLQGIWCNGYTPPWGSDYHTNINMQMNYWPAESANMSETVGPYIHFMKMISKFGMKTAKDLFDADGWTINHTTDVFGRTGVHDSVECGFLPMAGSWLCLNLWEHYEYTNDYDFLKEIYPIIKGSCEFVKSYLIENNDGMLVSSPSNSPENNFYYIDENGEKKTSMFTYGTTMDNQIIYALFTRTINACEILGCDKEFAESLRKTLMRLPPMRVSERYGTICEWVKDYEEAEPGHRHISHLFGLFPGDQINETDSVIYDAAKKTIARRLANGGGATGWSRAWIINFYARLKNGEQAEEHLKQLLRLSTAENLFDMHPPFQIDGNFGALSGMTEMLIQSHLGTPSKRVTELLPALPDSWKTGKIKGIKARGNFEFDIEWKDRKITNLKVTSHSDNTLYLKWTEGIDTEKYIVNDGVLVLKMSADESICLIG